MINYELPEQPPQPPQEICSPGAFVVNMSWCSGVILVYGSLPFDAFEMFTRTLGRDAVLSPILSEKFGATFAFVESVQLSEELVNRFAPKPKPGCGAQKWLDSCWGGLSSKFMMYRLTNIPRRHNDDETHFPRDTADFERCLLFLDCVPEARDRMSELKSCCREWSNLVNRWKEIEDLLSQGDREKANQAIIECTQT